MRLFSLLIGSSRKNGRLGDPALPSLSLNSEIEQVVLVPLLVLVLEKSRYLSVTLARLSQVDAETRHFSPRIGRQGA
jgi:hypothetical protein